MPMPLISNSFARQHGRIATGKLNGSLTRGETKELRQDQREIAGMVREARSDGTVTKDERKEIRGAQREASADIYEAKHNDVDRGDGKKAGGCEHGKPGNRTPRADKREDRQTDRVTNGIKSGELTPREAKRLLSQQKRIAKYEAKAKKDGVVSPKERAKLERMQDRASQDIFQLKHNQRDNKYI